MAVSGPDIGEPESFFFSAHCHVGVNEFAERERMAVINGTNSGSPFGV